MKLIILLYSLVLGTLFVGCNSLRQEVAPNSIDQQPEQIVVACFISPQDTVLAARITRSSPVLGVNNQYDPGISNAIVTVSNGNQSVVLRQTPYPNTYYGLPTIYYRAAASQLSIVAGKTYTLTVQVPDGRSVKATCTVPYSVPLEQVTIDTAIATEFGDTRKTYYAQLRWRDPAGQTNYYRVAGNNEFAQRYTIRSSTNAPLRDTLVRYKGDLYFDNGSTITDVGRDGQVMTSTRGRLSPFSYTLVNGLWVATPPSGQLDAYLLNVDENYYQYHNSVERQNQTNENPFAEPVPILTNIQGGLGCFGAYNRSTVTIYVK